ncbi:MAG: peptidoglycan DD-metalloendopeptidase family protein [Clostridia bacterium]|nr:peptidoglycan DD-metalloendopeptidase family protein [Clostridia bacterium]
MKSSTKFLSIVFAFILFVSTFSFPVSSQTESDFQDRIDYWEDYISKNEAGEENVQGILDALDEQNAAISSKIAAKEKEIYPLRNKINELNEQIASLQSRITELSNEITKIEVQTDEQNKLIDETYEVLGERLRASYMAGETSELEIFLNASSFEDFLTRSELLRQVAKHDNEVVEGLESKIKELNKMLKDLTAKRGEIEESKAKIEADKKEVESEKAVLDRELAVLQKDESKLESNINKQNELLEKYQNNKAYGEKQKAKAEAEFKQWEQQMQADAGNSGSTGDGYVSSGGNHSFKRSSKGYISPLQDSNVYYSATYAQHSSRGSRSVDFCAPANRVYTNGQTYHTSNGAKIYAVADGTVVTSYEQTAGGNVIVIDHNNGMRTLYAHCRVRYVSAGQKVNQGDVIALVGNSGTAVYPRPTSSNPVSGSHLHFQMLLNGSPVNPEIYLPSPLV